MRLIDDWIILKPALLPRIKDALRARRPLRAWVTGCGCGEEAFALAMLLCEILAELPTKQRPRVQIFATDTDDEAIAFARRAWYPNDVAAKFPTQPHTHFLQREQAGSRISRQVRDLITFAAHDLKTDPPFAKVDLVIHREEPSAIGSVPLQGLAYLFHFSLLPDGLLLLTTSEPMTAQRDLFVPLGRSLYRRLPSAKPRRQRNPFVGNYFLTNLTPANSERLHPKAQAEAALLRHFAVPSVLVNEGGDILYFTGRTGEFLDMPPDQPRWNLFTSLPPELRAALPPAVEQSLQERGRVFLSPVEVAKHGSRRCVQVIVQPVQLVAPQTVLVVFREVFGRSGPSGHVQGELAPRATHAEQELFEASQENAMLRREMLELHERLGVANEELQSINEELLATNEDLRTSNDQIQAMNHALLAALADSEEAHRHVEALSHRLVSVQELERRQLSGELHDRTSPNLASMNILLKTLGSTLPTSLNEKLVPVLDDLSALLDDTTASIREICADLRPPVLDHAGLVSALESYSQQFASRTGIRVQVDATTPPSLSPEHESVLFRIAQEALTNCAKHSQAQQVDITLGSVHDEAVLTIADDGVGFSSRTLEDPASVPGVGLLTMRERAEFAGARFTLDSRPGHGTRITVAIGTQTI